MKFFYMKKNERGKFFVCPISTLLQWNTFLDVLVCCCCCFLLRIDGDNFSSASFHHDNPIQTFC